MKIEKQKTDFNGLKTKSRLKTIFKADEKAENRLKNSEQIEKQTKTKKQIKKQKQVENQKAH